MIPCLNHVIASRLTNWPMNRYEYLKYKSNLDLIPSLNSLIMVLIMGYLTISNYNWHHLETIIDTLSEILFRGNPPVRFLLWFDQLSTFLCNLLSRTVPRCNSPGNPSFETSGSQGPWRSEQSGPSHFKSTTAPSWNSLSWKIVNFLHIFEQIDFRGYR